MLPYAALSLSMRGRDGENMPEMGEDFCPALRASQGGSDKPMVVAFSAKDCGGDAIFDISPTLRAMNHHGSHANGGEQVAVCVTGQVTHALTSEGSDASEDGTGRGTPIVVYDTTQITSPVNASNPKPGAPCHALAAGQHPPLLVSPPVVRRLMPIECERLQGFPDDWTLVPIGRRLAADAPRYKQLGNSWAVPCVRWIGERILSHLATIAEPEPIDLELDEATLIWLMCP